MKVTVGEIQMFRKPRVLPTGIAFLLFVGVSAAAQPGLPPCAADFKAFCTAVQPGEGRLVACIKEHIADFSITCKARLVRAIVTKKECTSSVKEQCGGTTRNIDETKACLKEALANLSNVCKLVVFEAVLRKR